MASALLALDWGTSSLRAYLLTAGSDDQAQVGETRNAPWGIMSLPSGGYPAALSQLCGDWLEGHPDIPLLASGMVGSAQGWVEAPYVPCPAGAAQLAAGLASVPLHQVPGQASRSLLIVPGVLQAGELPNVMRGEETQVIGAVGLTGGGEERLMVLPGTHSKWVVVRESTIQRFSTFMTGELYAALRAHTILGRLMSAEAKADASERAFRRGLDVALQGGTGGLPATLFSVRTLGLTRQLNPEELPDYLSGLLIGAELAGALDAFGAGVRARPLILIGDARLCTRYQDALAYAGFGSSRTLAGATEAGLWQIGRAAKLIVAPDPSEPEVAP